MSLGTDDATAEFIQSHLDVDLEEVAQQPNQTLLRPSLSPFLSANGVFQLSPLGAETRTVRLILQVMSIKDVSLSRDQRSRALVRAVDLTKGNVGGSSSSPNENTAASGEGNTADDPAALVDATLQAIEDENDEATQQHVPLLPSGGQWRCLRLELSDGFQRVLAVEDVPASTRQRHCGGIGGVFAPNGLALGSKIAVHLSSPSLATGATLSAAVQRGVLRLHAGNAEVLGGRVRSLEVYWEAQARQQLAASTGRPFRQQQLPSQAQQQQLVLPQDPLPHPPLNHSMQSTLTSIPPAPTVFAVPSSFNSQGLVQPLRQWPRHVALNPPQTPFVTVAFITEVVSDMVINEPLSESSSNNSRSSANTFTYALLAQLSSPDAVERETQQQHPDDAEVTEDDHLTVDLGHAWLRQLVGMPAEEFRALSLSTAPADVARLTSTVEAVGQALEQFGKGRFTLVQRAVDGLVEVVKAEPER